MVTGWSLVHGRRLHLPIQIQFKHVRAGSPAVSSAEGPPLTPASFTMSDSVMRLNFVFSCRKGSEVVKTFGVFGLSPIGSASAGSLRLKGSSPYLLSWPPSLRPVLLGVLGIVLVVVRIHCSGTFVRLSLYPARNIAVWMLNCATANFGGCVSRPRSGGSTSSRVHMMPKNSREPEMIAHVN